MNGIQVKMARAALGWSVAELASRAGMSAESVEQLERGNDLSFSEIGELQLLLEAAGITLIDGNYSGAGGPGVRLTQPTNASIDVNVRQVVQYEEYLVNDAPPGAGG